VLSKEEYDGARAESLVVEEPFNVKKSVQVPLGDNDVFGLLPPPPDDDDDDDEVGDEVNEDELDDGIEIDDEEMNEPIVAPDPA
jgi:hypothetical protein